MPPTGMTLWRVKTAVTTILTGLLIPDTADVVLITRPASSAQIPNSKPRRVYLGDVANDEPIPHYSPAGQVRTEEYSIPILIDCLAIVGNQLDGAQQSMNKLAAIVAAIELQILNDWSWGASCTQSGLSLVMEATDPLGDQPSGTGWRSSAVLDLHVMARGV